MEALLSLSFDNITSSSPTRIRKGLRQIEGLLAQICLSRNASQSPMKRRASVVSIPSTSLEKKLGSLIEDPAYREFWRLQESFEWNGEGDRLGLHARAIKLTTVPSSRLKGSLVPGEAAGHAQQYVLLIPKI